MLNTFNTYLTILKSKKDSFSQLEELTFEMSSELDYIDKSKTLKNKSALKNKVLSKYCKLANEVIKDLAFCPEDFKPDKK